MWGSKNIQKLCEKRLIRLFTPDAKGDDYKDNNIFHTCFTKKKIRQK